MAAARYWPIVSFVAGELSPLLRGRLDIAQHRQGCESLVNFMPMVHGGVIRRPGTQRMASVVTAGGRARLAHFRASDGGSFIIEFAATQIKIFDVTGAESPVTLSAPWSVVEAREVDYAQADDTMVIVHPDHAPRRLLRFEAETWALDAIPFDPVPTAIDAETFAYNTWTPSGTGTGSITFTGSGAYASDVGRVVRRGIGYGVITAVSVGVSFTATVTRGFTATTEPFIFEGQPNVTMTPGSTPPVGQAITVTGGGDWRTNPSEPRVLRINGGSVLLTGFSSSTAMTGIVLDELDSTTASPPGGWTMEYPTWSVLRGYPRAVTFHEQRLWFAGWKADPQGIVASGVGLYFDFRRTDLATDALAYALANKQAGTIEYLVSDADLVALTSEAEVVLERTNEAPISASNPPRARRRSNHGCARVRPVEVGDEVLFVSRDQRRIMAMRYDGDARQYSVTDITKISEHLLREGQGVGDLAYCRSPVPTVYATTSGGFVACWTYDPAEGVVGAWRYVTEGSVESMAVGRDTDEDVLWLQTSRSIGRFIERARPRKFARRDDFLAGTEAGRVGLHVDCAEVTDSSTTQTTSFPANSAANGIDQRVIADGYDAGDIEVASGAVPIPGTHGALYTAVGFAYESILKPMPPEMPTAHGTGVGRPVRKGPAVVKLWRALGGSYRAAGAASGFDLAAAPAWPPSSWTVAVPYVTGEVSFDLSGWDHDTSPVEIRQDKAMPMTVLFFEARMANSP